ncbi:MAG: ATP-binding cassette domain-containing protein [Lachnospiraceae bacterium]|jgi:ABC-2 type transport system ATP-binding protein|nr:ATP-binding cassette domain-containing protein [uncultured Acetatifactor sp.]MCI9229603.1 ATP-binding cassette domain-containing protein [Lachnospiraceae bacterium]MCI9571163.1 ATP-binding cassette domain-containing protein [Lachnospiraceae bacterium]
MQECSLKVMDASKKFKEGIALEHISFEAYGGSITGFVGHNGSGKTVLFKCICGFYAVTEGEILINGKTVGIGEDMPHNIAFTIEEPAFIGEYSGRRNLEFLYGLRHRKDSQRIKDIMATVKLDYDSRKKVAKYSLGMKQRLSIAQVLMEEMPILIMDEPMNGLDRQGVKEVRELLLAEKKKGKIILLASHNSEDIEYLCDTIYKLENGRMIS